MASCLLLLARYSAAFDALYIRPLSFILLEMHDGISCKMLSFSELSWLSVLGDS